MGSLRTRVGTVLGAVALMATSTSAASAQDPKPELDPPGEPIAAAAAQDLRVPVDEAARVVADKSTQGYVVMLAGDPVVAYDGDVAGLAATRPEKGKKLDPEAKKVKDYKGFLVDRSDRVLKRRGIRPDRKTYDYTTAFNGFAAQLTAAQADQLRRDPLVVAVVEDAIRTLTTDTTPEFLGLLDPTNGAWRAQKVHGDDVIVGVIDSGIWPENPSFTDRARKPPKVGERFTYTKVKDFNGACETGEQFDDDDCNRKVVGARWYAEGFGGGEAIKAAFPEEFLSPRDADGHGTHTASTAAGNQFVNAPVAGSTKRVSGIAPRARIAAYKVCWGYEGQGGCATSDSVAAIDQAVADGVDVINYSISGTGTNFLDPVEIAFLFAADAGVKVNASAGNNGPGAGTINHPSPWITTVAAGTESQAFEGGVTLGNGDEYGGAPSIGNPGTPQLPLVLAREAAADGVDEDDAALCFADTLDPAVVAGTVVLCERGVIARVAKSAEVARAGGDAMILGNTSPNSLNSDNHAVPTTHVAEDVTLQIVAYAQAAANPTAAQAPAVQTKKVAPDVATFSSRGPLAASDLLKPDILAPGVDVLAAYSPNIGGRQFDYLSGTSMSSPHMAGMSALLTDAHPSWSPAAVKSALMTTAYTERTDGSPIPGGPFAYGSGHAAPNDALDPGLVYDAGFGEYLAFVCGIGQLSEAFCTANGVDGMDPSDLNQPNIAVGELAGTQTVERTVTNVDEDAGLYEAVVDAPAGVEVEVVPPKLLVPPGASRTYRVTFTTAPSAELGETVFGSLTWSSVSHDVRSQLVVTPVQLAAPDTVRGTGTDGATTYEVGFGYDGEFDAQPHGLEPATRTDGSVVDDPANDINTALGSGVGITIEFVDVPAGQAWARFSLFDEFTDGEDDLDLYVFDPDGFFVGGSGSGTSQEQVDVPFPDAGTWFVVVHGWQTDGPDANYTLFDWSFSATPGSTNLAVDAPSTARLGTTADVEIAWNGLASNEKYLGAVSYSDAVGLFGLTLVEVETG